MSLWLITKTILIYIVITLYINKYIRTEIGKVFSCIRTNVEAHIFTCPLWKRLSYSLRFWIRAVTENRCQACKSCCPLTVAYWINLEKYTTAYPCLPCLHYMTPETAKKNTIQKSNYVSKDRILQSINATQCYTLISRVT